MTSIIPWPSLQGQIIENRFEIGPPIGKGSFGEVYEARDKYTGKGVAVKVENRRSTHSQLKNEYQVYDITKVHCTLCTMLSISHRNCVLNSEKLIERISYLNRFTKSLAGNAFQRRFATAPMTTMIIW